MHDLPGKIEFHHKNIPRRDILFNDLRNSSPTFSCWFQYFVSLCFNEYFGGQRYLGSNIFEVTVVEYVVRFVPVLCEGRFSGGLSLCSKGDFLRQVIGIRHSAVIFMRGLRTLSVSGLAGVVHASLLPGCSLPNTLNPAAIFCNYSCTLIAR